MANPRKTAQAPDWDDLYAFAEAQAGHFTTAQAASAGYSSPLLHKYLASGRIARVRRSVYRVTHFPAAEHEELVVLWLWAEQAGVFSHQSALAFHDLSDVLPAKAHMTLPKDWQGRRLRIPDGLVLHFSDVEERDCEWLEAVPITSPRRTVSDCIDAHVSPDLVQQALRQARQRGLISRAEGAQLGKRLKEHMKETR
jgi:predicted transcriptional regulator of viral defense system